MLTKKKAREGKIGKNRWERRGGGVGHTKEKGEEEEERRIYTAKTLIECSWKGKGREVNTCYGLGEKIRSSFG